MENFQIGQLTDAVLTESLYQWGLFSQVSFIYLFIYLFTCLFIRMQPARCLAVSSSGGAAVPLMQCPVTSKLVLISLTSEVWQAESTHLVLIQYVDRRLNSRPQYLKSATLTVKQTPGLPCSYSSPHSLSLWSISQPCCWCAHHCLSTVSLSPDSLCVLIQSWHYCVKKNKKTTAQ